MKHLDDIRTLVDTLLKSTRFHALVIQSPSGWGKSTMVEKILSELAANYSCLGSYSTPLGLYNCLVDHSENLIVIDDAAGLFGDSIGMAILKAATWPSSGTKGQREVRWNSSHEKVRQPSIVFRGKLIIITNTLPASVAIESFLSRTLYFNFDFTAEEKREMLIVAARSSEYFAESGVALEVANFLRDLPRDSSLNLRSLLLGYELAQSSPVGWKETLRKLLRSKDSVSNLYVAPAKVDDQVKEFMRSTGLSRRSFFNHRKRYRSGAGSGT